jgi:hypothetical protein
LVASVQRFAEAECITLIDEYVEAESGKGADALDRRPQPAAAHVVARSGQASIECKEGDFVVKGTDHKISLTKLAKKNATLGIDQRMSATRTNPLVSPRVSLNNSVKAAY